MHVHMRTHDKIHGLNHIRSYGISVTLQTQGVADDLWAPARARIGMGIRMRMDMCAPQHVHRLLLRFVVGTRVADAHTDQVDLGLPCLVSRHDLSGEGGAVDTSIRLSGDEKVVGPNAGEWVRVGVLLRAHGLSVRPRQTPLKAWASMWRWRRSGRDLSVWAALESGGKHQGAAHRSSGNLVVKKSCSAACAALAVDTSELAQPPPVFIAAQYE